MSLPITRKRRAKEDLRSIARYIARDNRSAAKRFLKAAEKDFQHLSDFPLSGQEWESDEVPGLRFWPMPRFDQYVIFYRVTSKSVDVVRVLHGAQDLNAILSRE